MDQTIHPSSHLGRSSRTIVLGLYLSAQGVGRAVVSSEHLLDHGVTNLKKRDSREAKEARFRQVVENLLDRHGVTHIALVKTPKPAPENRALLDACSTWLAEEAARRSISLAIFDGPTVCAAHVSPGKQSTNRNLAEELVRRYPEELWRSAPSERPSKVRTNRERYWWRMFLALGAALHALSEVLLESTERECAP